MSVKFYSDLVSPFIQTKVLLHYSKLKELKNNNIVVPITCEIDLTDGFCNNKCKYCFFETDKKTTPVYMDKNVIKEVIRELYSAGTKAIEFSGGGEPSTHPYFGEILEYTCKLGIDVGLVTNGLLLNKYKDVLRNLKFVRISLDAACDETYNNVHGVNLFTNVINNIKETLMVVNQNIIGIGFIIVPENIKDILPAAKLASELGVRFIQYRPASLKVTIENEQWEIAASEVKRAADIYKTKDFQIFDAGVKWKHLNNKRMYNKCYTSSLVAVIKANGDIPLCVLKRNHPEEIIGNIYEGGFFVNWNSSKHNDLIKKINIHDCRKPCKHDPYNIMYCALNQDLLHKNFL